MDRTVFFSDYSIYISIIIIIIIIIFIIIYPSLKSVYFQILVSSLYAWEGWLLLFFPILRETKDARLIYKLTSARIITLIREGKGVYITFYLICEI